MQSEVTPVRKDAVLWTLRFISGKYQGLAATTSFEVNYQFTKIGEAVEIPSPS